MTGAGWIASVRGTVSVMRVHVTGATGFLGAELLRLAPRATGERVEVRDREAVIALFQSVRPDVVIHTAYGEMKADAEARVAAIAPDALLVRTSLIVGGPGHEPSKHEIVARDPTATFYEDEIRSPVQVGDLAAALLELATLDVSGPLNVAGADDVSRAELAELVAGSPVRRAAAPRGRPLDCSLDSARARSLVRTELRGVRTVFA